MSLVSCVEPHQPGEEPDAGQRPDQQHVLRDTQQMMEDQEQSDEKEMDNVLNAEGEVNKDEQRKENQEVWRKGATQKIHRRHVKQPDGTLAVSVSFVERDRDRRLEDPRGPGPFFFFGGNNGASIVVSYCESRGWQRIYDKNRLDYKLKWCETKSPATYYNFKAGGQLLYQIPNNKVLTTKIGLLNSLREYERVSSKVNYGRVNRRMKIEDFLPVTYRMDVKDEREAFFNGVCNDKSSMWICKPTGLNQGRGIFLMRTPEDIAAFRERLQSTMEQQTNKRSPFSLPQARVVQQYIQKPLLLQGRKFDVRSYFLIACTSPHMVFFRHGYIRLTCNHYDPNSDNITAHLTNQYMQKKNPLYSLLKEETVWSMEHFNTYINETYMAPKGLPKDWALGPFAKRMQQIIMHCFQAVKAKLDCRLGYFDLIGCDFLIDENFKVWLLEMNCNPALHTNCEVLKEVIPSTVTETLDLALEIFKKCCCGQKLLPLNHQRDFLLLYDGESMAMKKQMQKTSGSLANFNPKNTNKTYKSALIATPTWKSTNRCAKCPISGVTTEPPAKRPATSTVSVWSNTSPPSQQPIELPHKPSGGAAVTQKTRIPRTQETNQLRPHQPKPVRARVELHLSKCTWHEPATSNLNVPPRMLPVRSAIRSLSTPFPSKASNSTQGVGAQSTQMDNRDHISCNLKTSKIHFAHVDKREPKEKDG
ncbi:protein polyglycylase TTLL10 isoform X1 [Triplophysa rosa]|uniref:protein polyglycylase TTLL10 isoform X1 n=1 Tax=Triplophysa rosa TaxID=992332 RepID=UPI00254631D8|nr:protein polyglycylase TTLL10 isoform X1 [Triplophysa rosa]XP_057176090.1 protein polyglycylase TTLL10 isoform X1 [Triplophysa rosa]XP_057176091.1 protein polyglycylase TTLL10 isoform X1 [Triplophysa rosa]